MKKYNFELPENLKHLANASEGQSKFFTAESIDRFVETLSNVNLELAQKQILTDLNSFKRNILKTLKNKTITK